MFPPRSYNFWLNFPRNEEEIENFEKFCSVIIVNEFGETAFY